MSLRQENVKLKKIIRWVVLAYTFNPSMGVGKQKQEDLCEFQDSLVYTEKSCLRKNQDEETNLRKQEMGVFSSKQTAPHF